MDFLELAKKRYACRQYKGIEIEEEKLKAVLEAARLAPSACNNQPAKIIIVKEKVKQIAEYCGPSKVWIEHVPLLLAVVANPQDGWVDMYGHSTVEIDAAILIDHMSLAAADIGLGSCWIKGFGKKECEQVLSVPDKSDLIAMLALGYPEQETVEKKRNDVSDLIINRQ